MRQITINGTVYVEDALPDAAKGPMRGLQAVDMRMASVHTEISILKAKPLAYGADKRMAYLQQELEILETARGAYDRALVEVVAAMGGGS